MKLIHKLIEPPWRTIIACAGVIVVFLVGYQLWTPGKLFTDGRHDVKSNGIWLQHGWLGDDEWFRRYKKNPYQFRDPIKIIKLKELLIEHHITDVYPHLAPCQANGKILSVDPTQIRQLLEIMNEFRVIPWVGGVLDVHAFPESKQWRDRFINSISSLLNTYPSLAGIHINIEPMPSGDTAYLELLQELKSTLPKGKILSIAAYPPPTIYQRTSDVHWDRAYYERVAQEVDQMVIMMYDTSLRYQKLYQNLIASWTQEVLEWVSNTDVLLGLPAYEDEGVDYHHPHVENLRNGLLGIHAGLSKYESLPKNYRGISIYSEWVMNQEEWDYLKANYCKDTDAKM